MNITIEDNRVIVNLDPWEVEPFRAMFENLDEDIHCTCEFREFAGYNGEMGIELKPMHLCRTIGEANLSGDPFATMSLYPFWKYGFAFGGTNLLKIDTGITDKHKKAVAADEFGMGFTAWAMEEIFDCEYWADVSTLIKIGAVFPTGTKRPDFVCTFKDGSLGVFEAKGTTGTSGNITGALASGKLQTADIGSQDGTGPSGPIAMRAVVGAVLGEDFMRVIILDPPGPSTGSGTGGSGSSVGEPAEPTNLTADLVKKAAIEMRRGARNKRIPSLVPPLLRGDVRRTGGVDSSREKTVGTTETIFRAPGLEITLKYEDLREDKRHGWLDILK